MKLEVQAAEPLTDPGELKHRITFLGQVLVAGSSGQEESWQASSPPLVVKAKIDPISGRELLRNGQDITQEIATVTVRYNAAIVKTMRFRSPNGGEWIIQNIANVENRWMVMTCSQAGPDKA